MKQVRIINHKAKRMRLRKVTRVHDEIHTEFFDVEEKKDAHSIKYWYGEAWYVDKGTLGRTITISPGYTVKWSLEENRGAPKLP